MKKQMTTRIGLTIFLVLLYPFLPRIAVYGPQHLSSVLSLFIWNVHSIIASALLIYAFMMYRRGMLGQPGVERAINLAYAFYVLGLVINVFLPLSFS